MAASNRSLFFLLGLVLGLLVGAGFFIFKMDDLLKNGNLFYSSRDTLIILPQPVIDNPKEKKSKTAIKTYFNQQSAPSGKDTEYKSMTSADLIAQKYSETVPVNKIMAEADSLLQDADVVPNAVNQKSIEDFIVRKDELIGSRTLDVIIIFQKNEIKNSMDSLLERVSGIKNQKNAEGSFKVEFWKSPVNYNGYKMTKNKIVLFGINPEANIKLFHLEGTIFMKHNTPHYYKLHFTDDFKQFEKVRDPSVIATLEK